MSNRAEEVVRQALFAIVRQHGSAIYSDPRRLEALLKDLAGPHPREIRILVEAVREDIPIRLVAAMKSGEPIAMVISRMVKHLDDLGNKPEIARWSIETWVAVLKNVPRTSSYYKRDACSAKHRVGSAGNLPAVEQNTPLCKTATVGHLDGSVNVVAALLSLHVPGLGQLVQGCVICALFWFGLAVVASSVIWLFTLDLPIGWFLICICACIHAALYRSPD